MPEREKKEAPSQPTHTRAKGIVAKPAELGGAGASEGKGNKAIVALQQSGVGGMEDWRSLRGPGGKVGYKISTTWEEAPTCPPEVPLQTPSSFWRQTRPTETTCHVHTPENGVHADFLGVGSEPDRGAREQNPT